MFPLFVRDFRPTLLMYFFESFHIRRRDCHTLWSVVPDKFVFMKWETHEKTIKPHFLFISERIRSELCRFQSPLLTASLLISFPAPTKMFQFGAFLIMTDLHIMCRDVPLGDLRFIDSLRLPWAYRSLARPSSAPEPSHPPVGVLPVLLNWNSS